MKREKGNWQVRRNCCTSGYCHECHEHGTLGKPQPRVVQADGYSQDYATWVAGNWCDYKAQAEPMPG